MILLSKIRLIIWKNLIILLILLLGSCSRFDKQIKQCKESIKFIVEDPKKISLISEKIEISSLLKESIPINKERYIHCFNKFNGKYKINDILYSTNKEENREGVMIYIIDYKNLVGVQFQFKKYANKVVLHNIILSNCLEAYP